MDAVIGWLLERMEPLISRLTGPLGKRWLDLLQEAARLDPATYGSLYKDSIEVELFTRTLTLREKELIKSGPGRVCIAKGLAATDGKVLAAVLNPNGEGAKQRLSRERFLSKCLYRYGQIVTLIGVAALVAGAALSIRAYLGISPLDRFMLGFVWYLFFIGVFAIAIGLFLAYRGNSRLGLLEVVLAEL